MSKQYDYILTKEFFNSFYIEKDMSFPKIHEMLKNQGVDISISTLYKYSKKYNIGRDSSEARILWDDSSLDYTKTFLNKDIIEAIDGFLLGDGCLYNDKRCKNSKTARITCGLEHRDFCEYLMEPFQNYKPIISKQKSKTMKQGYKWIGQSKYHPDLYVHWKRWYKEGKTKQPPDDVRITPTSVLMWYLGDGSLVKNNKSICIRLSTDGFHPDRVDFLISKLNDKDVKCHRNNDNRIQIKAKGIPNFFKLIGKRSPIKCYQYKFDLPFWRFEAKRMKEVSEELGIAYNKLSNWIKQGYVPCYRESPKSFPRFLPEHIEEIKKYAENG